jgi:hypothetical protein
MRFLAAAAILVVLVATPRPVHACSCSARVALSPADASTDVPLNAIVIAQINWRSEASIELRDATSNQLVALAQEERTHGTIFAVPLEPLAPNTTYTVTLPTFHGNAEVSSFTTGESVDTTPPTFAGVTGLSLETMQWPLENGCYSSCLNIRDGRVSRTRLEFADPPPDAVHVALQLYRPGEGIIDEVPVSGGDPRLFGFEICDTISPALVPDMEYCARVVAYDVAGNIAGLGAELCEVARACEPRAKSSDCCSPVDECSSTPPPPDECRSPPPPSPTVSGCNSTFTTSPLLVALLWLVRRKRKEARASLHARAGFP